MEYVKKARVFIKWLVPFALAMLLLFGCGRAPLPMESKAVQNVTQESTEQAAPVQGALQQPPSQETQTMEQVNTEMVSQETKAPGKELGEELSEDGHYTGKDEVALYLHTYGRLPDNYITKKQAEKLGWNSKDGNLWEVAPGMSIGGTRFGNYEGELPDKDGRKWFECDINFEGGFRGAERIVYSDDGLIFYTGDHYKTFEQLY